MEKLNPSNRSNEKSTAERKRIPMSVPIQRLEAPDIPGYHLHWFNGTAERIQRAQDGGYEFVDARELRLNNASLGGDSTQSGNTDMGSQVSVVSGEDLGRDGQPNRMILMKIKQEWYEEDQKLLEDRNSAIAQSLLQGTTGAQQAADSREVNMRYIDKNRTAIPDLFKPKRPRAAPS